MSPWTLVIPLVATGLGIASYSSDAHPDASVRFETVNLRIDSARHPLGAYQLEFAAATGQVRIVGIEGGEHPAFTDPPYYDPDAIQNDRVILADFNTAAPADLPRGQTRIATIHLQITGTVEPEYQTRLTVAADHEGNSIHAIIEMEETQPRGR